MLKDTGMLGLCEECKQEVKIFDTHIRLIMAHHDVFETVDEYPMDNRPTTCPASFTGNFSLL